MNNLLSDKKKRKLILDERIAWRNIFSSPSGKMVFRQMAAECHFFDSSISADDVDAISRNNYFKIIIERLGVFNYSNMTAEMVTDAILDALLKLPLTVE